MSKSVCVREREQEGENIEGKEGGRWRDGVRGGVFQSILPVQRVLIMSQSVVVWS